MSVYLYLYMSVPFSCNLFRGLRLVIRSHDQFGASDWSTLLPYLLSLQGAFFNWYPPKFLNKLRHFRGVPVDTSPL